jgi:hypothetical protein
MGQMAIYTLTMCTLAWHCIERRRDKTAGFWLALAISTKVYPATLIVFFLLKRKWRALGSTLVCMAIMNVGATALAMGPTRAWELHRQFYRSAVQGHSSVRLAVIESDKMSYTNQSTALVARRYTRPTDSGVDKPNGSPRFINVVYWDDTLFDLFWFRFTRVQWALLLFHGILAVSAIWICRHPARGLGAARLRHEYAAFLTLGLLLSPIVWSFYYCVCYLPLALVTWHALASPRSTHGATAAKVAIALWWLAVPAMALPFARMCGFHLLATLVLFGAQLLIVRTEGQDHTGSELPVAPPA